MSKPAETFEELRLNKLRELAKLKAGERAALSVSAEDVYRRLRLTPNAGPQTKFLELPDEDLDVLYGGSAGGGKSWALFVYALRMCAKYPMLQAFWFRRTFPELEHSVLRMLQRIEYAKELGCVWNDGKKELRFPNRSVLTFAHAKNLAEATSLQSAEVNLLLLDERTTLNPEVVNMLYTRVRSGVAGVPCLGIRSATNPGGPGHGQVRLEYVEATDYGKNVLIDKYKRKRMFIQARVTDTPQLGEEYRLSLEGLPDDLRRAFLDGDWTVFSGQIFGELRRDRHVIEPQLLPESWRRYAGVDWGWSAPWAVVWGALDEDGRVWIYREVYESKVRESDQALRILQMEEGEDVSARFADDAMWAARGEAKAIADIYDENGCHLAKAGKGTGSRLAGFARIHSYLAEAPACRFHAALGWETCPKIHIFSNCDNLYREMENLPHATTGNVEDSDPTAADHAVDALRYLLVNIGNDPQWFFMEDGDNLKFVTEDQLPRPPQTPVSMIGGYPIMEGKHPWEF